MNAPIEMISPTLEIRSCESLEAYRLAKSGWTPVGPDGEQLLEQFTADLATRRPVMLPPEDVPAAYAGQKVGPNGVAMHASEARDLKRRGWRPANELDAEAVALAPKGPRMLPPAGLRSPKYGGGDPLGPKGAVMTTGDAVGLLMRGWRPASVPDAAIIGALLDRRAGVAKARGDSDELWRIGEDMARLAVASAQAHEDLDQIAEEVLAQPELEHETETNEGD